jgi:hypothetical protein
MTYPANTSMDSKRNPIHVPPQGYNVTLWLSYPVNMNVSEADAKAAAMHLILLDDSLTRDAYRTNAVKKVTVATQNAPRLMSKSAWTIVSRSAAYLHSI